MRDDRKKGRSPRPAPRQNLTFVAARASFLVPTGRFELPPLAALAPQASVSTNSTTSATSKGSFLAMIRTHYFGAGAGGETGALPGADAGAWAGALAGGGTPPAGAALPLSAASSRIVLCCSLPVVVPR